MKTEYVYPNGTPVPEGQCVSPEVYVTTLSIKIRAMQPITGEALKDLVQTKWEVLHQPEVTQSLAVVRPA